MRGCAWLSDYCHIGPMPPPPPNQLVSAAASLQLICNSHSKAWWQSSSLMTIHQDSVMRGAVEMCGPYGRPLRWHLQGHGEAIVSQEATPTLILRLRFETVEKFWLWDQKVARSACQYRCFGGFHSRLKLLGTLWVCACKSLQNPDRKLSWGRLTSGRKCPTTF